MALALTLLGTELAGQTALIVLFVMTGSRQVVRVFSRKLPRLANESSDVRLNVFGHDFFCASRSMRQRCGSSLPSVNWMVEPQVMHVVVKVE